MSIPFRLRVARTTYNRNISIRSMGSLGILKFSDPLSSPWSRANKNIRRLKFRYIKLTRPRLITRRSYGTRPQLGRTTVSDPQLVQTSLRFKRTWKYWRAR